MKYAVLESGGKQYIASEGESIEVDRMPGQAGAPVKLAQVLLVADGKSVTVGTPYVAGATVEGTIDSHFKAPKVIVFRYIPKERYRRRKGHRQGYTRINVQRIGLPGSKTAEGAEAAPSAAVEQAPAKKAAKKATIKKASSKKAGGQSAAKKAPAKKAASKKSTAKKSSG
jgi:large subunit ribosomal protein L21